LEPKNGEIIGSRSRMLDKQAQEAAMRAKIAAMTDDERSPV
jgi:hypothetical protein